MIELAVGPEAPVAGRTLGDVSLPRSLVVSGPGCDGVANVETELKPDVRSLVAAEAAVVGDAGQLFPGLNRVLAVPFRGQR